MNELVKILNPSKKGDANYRDLTLVYQGQKYTIEPGGEVIVPIEVAAAFFGHPKARDTARDRARSDTYQQVRFQWGYQLGQPDAAELWEEQTPPFRVTTLKDEWLPMVLDDPAGLEPLPGSDDTDLPPITAETAVLQRALAAQQAQIDQLTKLISDREVAENPGVLPDDAKKSKAPVESHELPKPKHDESKPSADAPRTTAKRADQGTTIKGS